MYKRNKTTKQAGFTLMELMIVMVIIGMLATLVVPAVMNQLASAQLDKARNDIARLGSILESYKIHNNRFPTTEQGLEALVSKPDLDPVPKRYQPGGYVKKIPKDPWDNHYQYVSPNEEGSYDLYSWGPDGNEGTDDDIGNWKEEDEQ